MPGHADDGRVEVHLLRLPVGVHARAQEHGDDLIRELTLIAAQLREQGDHAGLPVRLVALVAELTAQYGRFTGEQEERLARAVAAREEVIDDLVFQVPAAAAGAALHLGQMLDEADQFCRRPASICSPWPRRPTSVATDAGISTSSSTRSGVRRRLPGRRTAADP